MRNFLANLTLFLVLPALILADLPVCAGDFSVSIRGEVHYPQKLTTGDLQKMSAISLRLRQFYKSGNYEGLCTYRGVPLQLVLERAKIQKPAGALFRHKSDMVIWAENISGRRMALSWGEIFYASNPTHYLLVFRRSPIRPTAHPSVRPGSCLACHNGRTRRKGKILPRVPAELLNGVALIVARGGNVVGFLNNLCAIEVSDVQRNLPREGDRNHIYSNRVTVIEGKRKVRLATILNAQSPRLVTVRLSEIGSGCGYHGTFLFSGFPLSEIFATSISNPKFWGLLVSAPDGYRTFVSKNEVVGALGRKALLAVKKQGQVLKEPEGKFMLVLPNDMFFDRWIRAVDRIEILNGGE